jgi:hypothetical protein
MAQTKPTSSRASQPRQAGAAFPWPPGAGIGHKAGPAPSRRCRVFHRQPLQAVPQDALIVIVAAYQHAIDAFLDQLLTDTRDRQRAGVQAVGDLVAVQSLSMTMVTS